MPSPDDDASRSQKQNDTSQDQSKPSLDDMEETTHEDYASSVDSMATASTMRPSAIPDPSSRSTSAPRSFVASPFEADDPRASDNESSLGGAITPRCGQVTSDHLFTGTSGSSIANLEDFSPLHFDAELEVLMHQRRDSFASCEIRKALQNAQPGPISNNYGPYQVHLKQHVLEQLRLDRRCSGSSTLTSEPPGLTASSRATTFSEGHFFDDLTIRRSESPAPTLAYFNSKTSRESEDTSHPQDMSKLSGVLTKEPLTYTKSPLSRSFDAQAPQFRRHRSPQPPVSDSGESEDGENRFGFDRRFLPPGLVDEDEQCTSDSECSDQGDDFDESHPLFDIKPAVVQQSLLEYKCWKTSTSGETGNKNSAPQQSTSKPGGEASSTKRGFGKRARQDSNGNGNEDGEEEDGDEPPQKKPALSPGGTSSASAPLFACPFAKKDHIKYESCFSLKLTKIKNVKQHLRRSHEAPVYCPNCRNTFEEEEELESHLRDQERCEKSDKPIPEGMTPAQRKKLEKRVRSKLWVDQWYEIYDILFEGSPRPRSPYIPAGLNQKLRGFMDMMNERGHQIIMENISRRELMRRLEGLGLQANEDEEQMISSLLSASITDGLQEITNAWKSSFANDGAVPSLTEGETVQSSTNQPEDEVPPGNERCIPNANEGMKPNAGALAGPSFVSSELPTQDTSFNDDVVFCPDGPSMQTPHIDGGEFVHVNPNFLQLMDNRDQEMWDACMQPYSAQQDRPN